MGRKEDLEQNIRESYKLIREYEEILRLSSDPREKTRAQRAIKEQRELIRTWLNEYQRIGGGVLPDHITQVAVFPPDPQTAIPPMTEKPRIKPQKAVPLLGYFFVALLALDLMFVLVLGWRFFGDQPELLSYLEVVTGFLGIGLEILLVAIVIQRKMSVTNVLHWLGTNRLWQGIISVVTIALLVVVLWPQTSPKSDITTTQQPAIPQDTEAKPTPSVTYTLLAPPPSGGGPSTAAILPWLGPISFCLQLDSDNRCISPTSHLPAGTTRFYASWPFQDVPLGTHFRRVWYRDGKPIKSVDDIWDEDWNSPTGVEYTYYEYQEGFPDGHYTLEPYFKGESEPVQQATVRIGP